ncbi:MAG: MOSC domain-containing protein [Cellvibrionaceae bacterium]
MIETILYASKVKEPMASIDIVQCVAGKGIVGDRNYQKVKNPGQSITFIEAEEIERFNQENRQQVTAKDMRRNVVTRGVLLNDLVGKTFSFGDVVFQGMELCEPCSTLGKTLETDDLPKAAAVRALVHRAGIRAEILSSGNLQVGMSFSQLK